MTYVDDLYKYKAGKFGRMKMSHMISDSTEELLEMALAIGLNEKWIQHKGTYKEHFDVSLTNRNLAVSFGAKEITYRELGQMVIKRKTN